MKLRLALIAIFLLELLALGWWMVKYLYLIVVAPHKAWRLAVSADQLANSAFNGNEDETISSRAGRHSQNNTDRECWAVWLCWLLDKIDPKHCEKNIGV
jgi:hypothetical protein